MGQVSEQILQVFQSSVSIPVKWDHSKYCILNHIAEHGDTLPGGDRQQQPEPFWVLSRSFLFILLLIALPQLLCHDEPMYSVSSKATFCSVRCFLMKYNMARQNLIHSFYAIVHIWCIWAIMFPWRFSSFCFFSILPVSHVFYLCL